jgi:hypothetical protein
MADIRTPHPRVAAGSRASGTERAQPISVSANHAAAV